MAVLLVMVGVFAILSVYVKVEYPLRFHFPVIAANAAFLAAVILSRVPFSGKSGGAFILLAVPVNVLVLAGATGGNDTSVGIAFVITLLCTGLTGLVLLSRTGKPVSKATRISVTGFLLEMTVMGPVLHLAGLEMDFLFVMASLPMIPLTLTAFLVFSARHSSEQTLPSDKWV
ncbi:MAG: hypothetical protein AB7S97_05685 [Thermoplasmata archaeon]